MADPNKLSWERRLAVKYNKDYQKALSLLMVGKLPQKDTSSYCEFSDRSNKWLCAYECICWLTSAKGLSAVYLTYIRFRKWEAQEYGKLSFELQLYANMVSDMRNGADGQFPLDSLVDTMNGNTLMKRLDKLLLGK